MSNSLKMNVLVIEPDKNPHIKNIWNDLEELRKIIKNSSIEVIEYKDLLIIYDETALAKNIKINRYMDGLALRGTFILTGNEDKTKDFTDLTQEQIEKYTKVFNLEREEEIELE